MIYATCTFSPEENEENIDFLINKYPNAEILEVDLSIDNIQEGITKWEDKEFSLEVKKAVRILPEDASAVFSFVN